MPLPTLHSHPGTTSLGSYLSCKKNLKRCNPPPLVSLLQHSLTLPFYQTADVWNGLWIPQRNSKWQRKRTFREESAIMS